MERREETISETIYPGEFEVCIGGCFGPTFSVRLMDGKLVYEKSPGMYSLAAPVEIESTPERWAAFWSEIERIGVWGWSAYYENARPGEGHEGAHWYVRLAIGDRTVTSEGDSAYPGDDCPGDVDPEPSRAFEAFLGALRALLGGAEMR